MAVKAQLKLSIRFNRKVSAAVRNALRQKAEGMFTQAHRAASFDDFQFEVNAQNQPVNAQGNVITLREVVLKQAPKNVTAYHDGQQKPTATVLSDDVTETYYEVGGVWYCEFCFDLEDLTEGGMGGTVQFCIVFPM